MNGLTLDVLYYRYANHYNVMYDIVSLQCRFGDSNGGTGLNYNSAPLPWARYIGTMT